MTRHFKLVALALMLILGALPLLGSAVPSCLAKARSSDAVSAVHHCCPPMAMATEDAGQSLASQANAARPCCRVAPAKPVRVALQMPAAAAELALQPANEPVMALSVPTQAQSNYHIPLSDSASLQSHLCTFLI
jgi:hypothetical protein